MAEFSVLMSVEYYGAWAYITADTEEEAKKLAESGQWHSLEINGAELVDWSIERIEENK